MTIEEIKKKVIEEVRFDPFIDPNSWELIEKRIPQEFWSLLCDRAGAAEEGVSLNRFISAKLTR